MPTTLIEYAAARRWVWDKIRSILTSDLPAAVATFNTATGYPAASQVKAPQRVLCNFDLVNTYRAGQRPNPGDVSIALPIRSSTPRISQDIAGTQGDELVIEIQSVIVCDSTTVDAAMRNAESLALMALNALCGGLIDPPGSATTVIWRVDPETSASSTASPMGKGLFFVSASPSIRVYVRSLQVNAPRRMVDGTQGAPFVVSAAAGAYTTPRLFTAVDGVSARTTLQASMTWPGSYTIPAASVATGAVIGLDWPGADPAGATMSVVSQKAPTWPSDSGTLTVYVPQEPACIVDTSGALGNPVAGDVWTITVVESTFAASRTVRVTWS